MTVYAAGLVTCDRCERRHPVLSGDWRACTQCGDDTCDTCLCACDGAAKDARERWDHAAATLAKDAHDVLDGNPGLAAKLAGAAHYARLRAGGRAADDCAFALEDDA